MLMTTTDQSRTVLRFPVLDCLISRTNMACAAESLRERITEGSGGYVCFSNVHTVVTSRKDTKLRDATNDSFLSVPDGKPLSIVARWRGLKDVDRVAGPDFMPHFIGTAKDVRHFFYGSTPETLEKLAANLRTRFPGVQIAGTYSPPFGPMSPEETKKALETIRQARPDLIWVGLGAPKQEYWMAQHWQDLRPAVLLGVGAAFDFHAGQLARAPSWVRRSGLEWLHRLLSEPRRLWKRYLVTNSLFIYYLANDLLWRRINH